MKSRCAPVLVLLLVSSLALGFTHHFIASAWAAGCDTSGTTDKTVTCTDTSDGDISTSGGNDSVSVDNSDVGNIDVGAGNNTIDLQKADLADDGIQAGDGNNSINADNSPVVFLDMGDGNNTLNATNGANIRNTTLGDGNNQVSFSDQSHGLNLTTGDGSNTITVGPDSYMLFITTGDGNDTIVTNATSDVSAGNGNDVVTVTGPSPVGGEFAQYDGGDGDDKLTINFTVGSQKQKDSFKSLVQGTANSGTVSFGGMTYIWTNFEELELLLKVAHASGHDDVSVSVLKDSRLNHDDVAAPIAIYCKAGQIEGWVIDPSTGNGNEQFVAPLSAFPTSSNGVDGEINGDQATVSYGGYSYSFPVAACP